jgi:hypothetical protein
MAEKKTTTPKKTTGSRSTAGSSEGPKSMASAPKTTAQRRSPAGSRERLEGAGKDMKPEDKKARRRTGAK